MTALGLSFSLQDRCCIMRDLSLRCMDSLVVACRPSCFVTCGILVPWPVIKRLSPVLQGRFLTTGPPGKSPDNVYCAYLLCTIFALAILQSTKQSPNSHGFTLYGGVISSSCHWNASSLRAELWFVCHSLDIWNLGGLVPKLCPTLVTPWTVARQAPLSMRFYRQEYWSGLPFPSPGDLPDLGT